MKRFIATTACLLLGLALLTAPVLGQEEVLGRLDRAPKSLLREQPFVSSCELGSAAAEAVNAFTGADIALVNAGDLSRDLSQGDVTAAEVAAVFHDDRTLGVAEVTPAELWAILEHSVSQVTVDVNTEQVDEEASRFDGFCQIAGFRFQYDASAPAGERLLKLELADGRRLGPEDEGPRLRLAATEFMLSGGYGYEALDYEKAEGGLTDALGAYVALHSDLSDAGPARIQVLGARQQTIAALFSPGLWGVGALVFIGFLLLSGLKLKGYRREYEEDPDMDSPYKRARR